VSAENGVRENGVRENGVRGRTVSEGERCQRENGVRYPFRGAGVADGIFQSKLRHRLRHPGLRTVRPAAHNGMPDVFNFLFRLGVVQPRKRKEYLTPFPPHAVRRNPCCFRHSRITWARRANSDALRFCRVGRTRQLKMKNRSDKTNRRSRDMPGDYTAAKPILKRKAAESLNSETLRYLLFPNLNTTPVRTSI
jgi:hypothetical protein